MIIDDYSLWDLMDCEQTWRVRPTPPKPVGPWSWRSWNMFPTDRISRLAISVHITCENLWDIWDILCIPWWFPNGSIWKRSLCALSYGHGSTSGHLQRLHEFHDFVRWEPLRCGASWTWAVVQGEKTRWTCAVDGGCRVNVEDVG